MSNEYADSFNRSEAMKLLGVCDNVELEQGLYNARFHATQAYNLQMKIIKEITANKHTVQVIEKMQEALDKAVLAEQRHWRQYEVIRHVCIQRGLVNESYVPLP